MTADHTIRNMKKHLFLTIKHTHQHFKEPKAKAAGGEPKAGCTRPEKAGGRHNADDRMHQQTTSTWAVAPTYLP